MNLLKVEKIFVRIVILIKYPERSFTRVCAWIAMDEGIMPKEKEIYFPNACKQGSVMLVNKQSEC